MDWTFAVFMLVFLVIAVTALMTLFRGETVGAIELDAKQLSLSMRGVRLIVKRNPPGPPDKATIQLQVRVMMGVNGYPMTPADAATLATVIETALRKAQA